MRKETSWTTIWLTRRQNEYLGEFLWDDPDQDQWSKITRIMVYQRNRRIYSGLGFVGSFDGPWSEWPWIIDPDLDHPKGSTLDVICQDRSTSVLKNRLRYMLQRQTCSQIGVNEITINNMFSLLSIILLT